MSKFLSLALSGGIFGGIYGLFASGLVLTYTTTKVFNFAYGAIAFCSAYVFFQLNSGLGLAIVPSALLTIGVFAPLLGLLLDTIIFRALTRRNEVVRIVATIGLAVALPPLILLIGSWLTVTAGVDLASDQQVFLPPGLGPAPPARWQIADGVVLDSNQLAVFVAAVIVAAGLWLIIRHTRLGLSIRATVDRTDLASARGIDTVRTSRISTVTSTTIAGLAGVLIAPLFNLEPTVFTFLMFVATAAAVIGRLQSIPIAMAAGVALGVVQSLVSGYVEVSPQLLPGLRSAVPFVLLLGGLLLLGRDRSRRAGTTIEETAAPDVSGDVVAWRRRLPWALCAVAFIGWVFLVDEFQASLAAKSMAMAVIFLSFVIVTGIGSMVSLAQAAFAMSGAVTAAILTSHGWPFFLAAAVGAVVAMLAGLLVAIPSLRLGGLSLALATLAMGFMADRVVFRIEAVTGGSSGRELPRPSLGPISLDSDRAYAIVLLAIFGLLALFVTNIIKSPTGRAMGAVRSSEVAAASVGVSPVRAKLTMFSVSAMVAGFGGALMASTNMRISSTDFSTPLGLVWVAVVAVFGIQRVGGAFAAGLAFVFLPSVVGWFTDSTLWPQVLFGLGAVAVVRYPYGLLSVSTFKRRRRTPADREHYLEHEQPPSTPSPEVSIDDGSQGICRLEGIVAGYGGVEVLHGIDFSVPRGGILAIVGPNGAGKSTLCSVMAGLLPSTAGSVEFDGVDISQLPADKRASIGLVLAPESRGIFPGLTVEENLAVWLSDPGDRELVMQRFPALAPRRKLMANLLSGGEQQILTMAPLLIRPPQLLISDEPTLGLAPRITESLFELMAELRDGGTTIVLVAEQAANLLEIADHIVVMDLGRVLAAGPVEHFDSQIITDLYFGESASGRTI
ncbi:MAG: ATP-binding cassette domain-containing protein [Ilumatobacteraceae bacterium]|nr:ATP-binding cassette domain-containing protein [Ilumatobacteraceae bacterium]